MNLDWLVRESGNIAVLLGWHLVLSLVPLVIGLVCSVPLGWIAHCSGALRSPLLGMAGLLYTIPSLAMFVLLPALLGTRILDPANVVVALSVYTVALLVRTVDDGLGAIAPETLQAADAMGYRQFLRFITVELPVAVPVITAGMRVAAVSNVSIVSVAALVGMPQLGALFTQGLQLHFITPIVVGIALCILLAVALDGLVVFVGRWLTPWRPEGTRS
ncbi:ABC transporter permease [Burkholderia gladioli pv. gladioli]|uniref:ABC transporter permease n=1 Tax=Burkholderia gladioli TaxID=28095 RepID=A0A095G174_BURGA|nr:ABC transporter permease [Burkholderia gladioli]AJW97646.1 binding--dependent transport system inner membrane component family protein [Burkholderia gladioli]ASD79857.1 ABC transporter permease [Burkholderia gladioli pv. gladioli]AWY54899.1 ABC transporter permease [Burkholderia gladioli pv. gladioli]KGC11122.1 binding--dependent transport system inner membrane component family protein [Burkholderia gladioli]MDJ1164116.1 ABC transporter permease [Burkholderia gladioli pv. gladioli]